MRDEASDSNRAVPLGFPSWSAYWTAQGMVWRTEPEIDEVRQAFLAERRAVNPDIVNGIYPFRDVHGGISLTRADVEWLLATHENGKGPVSWQEIGQATARARGKIRARLDLRGANLEQVDLSELPLTHVLGGPEWTDWLALHASPHLREAAALRCKGANLSYTYLEGAILRGAHFEGANLTQVRLQLARLQEAHFEGANLSGAKLQGTTVSGTHFEAGQGLPAANLQNVYFDETTSLQWSTFGGDDRSGSALLADVRWNSVNLGMTDWSRIHILGDEVDARKDITRQGRIRSQQQRAQARARAVRAYRQIALELRRQGMNEFADRYIYRAQCLQGRLWLRERALLRYFGSALLWMLAGYGYKPTRSVVTYLLVILSFAATYFALTNYAPTLFLPTHSSPLAWYEALVLSVSSFHGRGLFPTGLSLGDPVAILAAGEAIIGLLIEITFIATFTQRFFAR